MYQYQDQKEMRRALNGKMIVMLVGIMLVMTALTSSLSYGIQRSILYSGSDRNHGGNLLFPVKQSAG